MRISHAVVNDILQKHILVSVVVFNPKSWKTIWQGLVRHHNLRTEFVPKAERNFYTVAALSARLKAVAFPRLHQRSIVEFIPDSKLTRLSSEEKHKAGAPDNNLAVSQAQQ
jgi:hypothetical protein